MARRGARRGLLNLRATPDALPYIVDDQTIELFSNYAVLSERELEARYEVFLEQYVKKVNIESETAAAIARTLLLPAAARHLALMLQAQLPELAQRDRDADLVVRGCDPGTRVGRTWRRTSPTTTGSCMRSTCMTRSLPSMEAIRAVADKLEKVVADDLWPLPKYSEILFIK